MDRVTALSKASWDKAPALPPPPEMNEPGMTGPHHVLLWPWRIMERLAFDWKAFLY